MSAFANLVFDLPLDRTFTYRVPENLDPEIGMRVMAPFGRRSLPGFVLERPDSTPVSVAALKSITRVIDAEPLVDAGDIALACWVAENYVSSLGEALFAATPSGRRETDAGDGMGAEIDLTEEPLTLSSEQTDAVSRIRARPDGAHYLYGITGSGKTEVFLQVAGTTLEEGRGVIYLVPEIALTHQVIEVIRRRFGAQVAVIHSGLTPSRRLAEWRRVRRGEARLVVGARSAVFAPVPDLGLIVIDEEHEGSYKSGTTPRYHARGVAMYRCSRAKARLLMGSATPSVEAIHAMEQGTLERIELTARLAGGSLPTVEVVDLKGETQIVSRGLERRMRQTLDAGYQVILFLNRRGFSYFFHCRTCGFEMTCTRCSVGLTFHLRRNLMVCHYCGYSARPVTVCPECGSLDVGYSGFGTEMVEQEVAERFPGVPLARVDTDSVRKKGELARILDEFRRGETKILLGTQMVAKGLNFPGVQLVGIISADTGLHLPDFRAAERTFSLIVQVSGRAGRYSPDGRVVVQTYSPANPAISLAAQGRIADFYRQELAARRDLEFPPFSRLVRVTIRGRDLARVEAAGEALARRLVDAAPRGVSVMGPAESPIALIAHNHRRQVTLRSPSSKAARVAVQEALDGFQIPRGVYVEVDVDPVSLL